MHMACLTGSISPHKTLNKTVRKPPAGKDVMFGNVPY
jgi:hypothetical protein